MVAPHNIKNMGRKEDKAEVKAAVQKEVMTDSEGDMIGYCSKCGTKLKV